MSGTQWFRIEVFCLAGMQRLFWDGTCKPPSFVPPPRVDTRYSAPHQFPLQQHNSQISQRPISSMENLKDPQQSLPEAGNHSTPNIMQQPYQYRPLASLTSIRVLCLLPCHASLQDKQLHCKLEEVSLESNPVFQALSYTWGENVFPCTLLRDVHKIKITQNLRDALLHFQLPDKELRIWIDAICINQSDTEEKSHQIPLMEEIYRKASNVLIWLGTESEGSKEAIRYLTHIGSKFLERGGPVLEPKAEQHCEEHGATNKVLWEEVYGDSEMIKKTDVIWTRPWFSRR